MKTKIFTLIFSIVCLITLTTFIQKPSEEELHPYPMSETIASEFRPYVIDFLKDARKFGVEESIKNQALNLTVKFGTPSDIDPAYGGFCEQMTLTVIIDKNLWNNIHISKQAIIDHELGHCLLGRIHRHKADTSAHDPSYFNPKSIMFPGALNGYFYAYNKISLRKELFNKEKFNLMNVLVQKINLNSEEINHQARGDRIILKQIIAKMENEMNQEETISQELDFSKNPLIIESSARKDK